MNILWFTWKDKTHPQAGGAELLNEELAKRLVKDNHNVILLVGAYKNCKKEEIINGYKVIRLGNKYSLYLKAAIYYLKYLKHWPDQIIEEINTIPFMTQWYTTQKRLLFFHQLCREIWFHQIFFPLNFIGYLIEPLYLMLLNKNKTVTVSDSSKKDLLRYKFSENKIYIISEGIDIVPIKKSSRVKKYKQFTILSLGMIRQMKRTKDQIRAFELAKQTIPELKMLIAGNNADGYGQSVMVQIDNSPYRKDIQYLGKVSQKKKKELMQKSHVILVTSIKEGWGMIVTEANSQGTPAIVYNVDGLRDSVKNNNTGLITDKNTPLNMAQHIVSLYRNRNLYEKITHNALIWSNQITFEKSYKQFKAILRI